MLKQPLGVFATLLLLGAAHVTAVAAAPPGTCTLELEIDPAAPRWSGQFVEWLAVSPSTGLVARRFHRALVSAAELSDGAGAVEMNWGQRGDTLLLEPRREFSGTLAVLRISFAGEWADSGAGLSRDAAGRIATLPRLDASVAPMPMNEIRQRWNVSVHVPGTHRAKSNLPVLSMERTGNWRTWVYSAGAAVSLDSARVRIEPASAGKTAKVAHPPKKRRRR